MTAAVAAMVVAAAFAPLGVAWGQTPAPFLTTPGGGGAGEQSSALPAGDGREVVEAVCGGCHSLRMVTQQRLTRERWDSLIDWMVAEQGMAELDPETRDRVLDYLGTHLAPGQG